MAPPTLAQLLPPVTADEAKAVLLSALSGIGPVQQIGLGAGTLVVSGTPVSSDDVVIAITAGGAPGPGGVQFTYSLDGGATINGPYSVPSSGAYAIPGAGITLQFAGVFALGDQYLFGTIWPQFPVTDWESGSGGRTFTEAESATVADFAGNALAAIAGGGFVDYASPAWLPLLSHELYENDQFPSVTAQGLIQVSLATGASPKTFSAGQLVIANASGAGSSVFTYSNVSGFTISGGQTLSILFEAAQPGATFNLANGTIAVVQTPAAGLTVANPAPGISAVAHSGSGTGTVAASGSPAGNYSVVVNVLSSGGLGAAVVQVSLDGVNFASPFTVPASGGYSIPTLDGSALTGVILTFAGSFISGDTYSFTAYNSWILTPGQDQESQVALQARDRNKWTAISLGLGTDRTYDYLARSAPNGGSEVTRTSSRSDQTVAGQVDLTIAGSNGPVSSSALANISSYVRQFVGLCTKVVVSNVLLQNIGVTATIYLPAGSLASAQAAISTALSQLAASSPIGGIVFWSDILTALDQKQAGVRNVELTAPSPNTETQLANNSIPSFVTSLSFVFV